MPARPKRLVHPSTLLRMFKDLGYEKHILDRTATAGRPYKSIDAPPHQLAGAKSESVPYFLNGVRIAVCHQYTNPDGSLGASKKPDPKLLLWKGFAFYCHSWPKGGKCPCPTCRAAPEQWQEVFKSVTS